tara:strand:+ start:2183 stop:2809 length:627 start_codon:yes stop_codon:yes gene_type:complete
MSASVLPLTDLTVTAPAASQDLTELITFKQELGLSDSGSDALLARLVSEASAMVAGHCRRIFAREGLLERLLLTSGRSPLLLSRYPVAALDSVALDGQVLDATAYQLEAGLGLLHCLDGRYAGRWSGEVVLRYQAGWRLPGDESGPRDLPQEVERATLELAKSLWFARLRDPQLDSEDLPGVYKAVYGRSALPAQVISLLAPYRTRQI